MALAYASLLALSGCSTVHDFAGLPRTGYQANGTYVLSAEDRRLDCRRLKERSESLLDQLKAMPMRALEEIKEAPNTVAQLVGRMTGNSSSGVAAVGEYDQGRAEAAALNAAMAEKGCGTLDLDAELGSTEAEMLSVKHTPLVPQPEPAAAAPASGAR